MQEGLLDRPMAMAMGFMKTPPDGMKLFGPGADAFGHLGSGGARALAMPSKRLALCFVSNYQSEQRSIGVRTEAIVAAAGACVG
jgi:CubicO group peptidase (beta-lactamase class C family)